MSLSHRNACAQRARLQINRAAMSANANSSKPLSRDVLLEAWTIVLRYYVGSDMICFGCIDDASEPKHAVCHGDIPAHASLDALHKFTAKSMGNSVQAQSVKDWIRLNDLFNTLVWSQSSSDSNLEDLQDTQVFAFHNTTFACILMNSVRSSTFTFRSPYRPLSKPSLRLPHHRRYHRKRRRRMRYPRIPSHHGDTRNHSWRLGPPRSFLLVANQ